MSDRFTVHATDGAARAGVLRTAHGDVPTPAFMPVGTKATVKTVDPEELRELGTTILLGNTYHLHLRPGEDLIAELGGLHRFMGWEGPILTDSGGFQVFSLRDTIVAVDDDGVTFRSVYDGAPARFTPELVAAIQGRLGSDVAMCLDICPPAGVPRAQLAEAVRRTTLWAARQREVPRPGARSSGSTASATTRAFAATTSGSASSTAATSTIHASRRPSTSGRSADELAVRRHGDRRRRASGRGSRANCALRRFRRPCHVSAEPVRAVRVGRTQSNMSIPRSTTSSTPSGSPIPMK